jgi:hypothetical protein
MKGEAMKCLATIVALLACLSAATTHAGDAPHTVAGFTLGQDVATISSRLLMDTALPLRYQEYLQEVEIAPLPGFKSGLITYGICLQPSRIERIKLKYDDDSRAFYDALLARVERRFGKPTAYEGDPFHVVIDWKWSFSDADGNTITLHVSHNNRDTEEKFGNAVKLTWVNALDQERQCYLDKQPQEERDAAGASRSVGSMSEQDWANLIPH